jgi:hypothetical protein
VENACLNDTDQERDGGVGRDHGGTVKSCCKQDREQENTGPRRSSDNKAIGRAGARQPGIPQVPSTNASDRASNRYENDQNGPEQDGHARA